MGALKVKWLELHQFYIKANACRYENYGHKDSFEFFNGKSHFNDSIFGWNGHTENGSTVSSVKGENLTLSFCKYG